jgi:hypothetical protein
MINEKEVLIFPIVYFVPISLIILLNLLYCSALYLIVRQIKHNNHLWTEAKITNAAAFVGILVYHAVYLFLTPVKNNVIWVSLFISFLNIVLSTLFTLITISKKFN